MTNTIDEFLKLKDVESALKILKENNPPAKLVWVDYENEKKRHKQELISEEAWKTYMNELFIRAVQLNDESKVAQQEQNPHKHYRKVFISYNSEDVSELDRIVSYLKEHTIDFFVDHISMIPGENIKERVNKEILDREFIILLSKNSLASTWVFAESFMANIKSQVKSSRVIPLAIDTSLFQDDFTVDVMATLDADLKRLDETIEKFRRYNNNDQHFQTKRSSLCKFMSEYGSMINSYREAAVIRLYQNFEKGMKDLIQTLQIH